MVASGLFHLAIPVDDLDAARAYYGAFLGCAEGRSSKDWIDFDFFGHQLVAHLAPEECSAPVTNNVDGKKVPVRHFGIVLSPAGWHALAQKYRDSSTAFIIDPTIRFEGKPGEQGTFFVSDPAGNALEFKYFEDPSQLFAK